MSKSNEPSSEAELLKGAVKPTAITGLISIIASAIFAGLPGFYGALLAQFIVVIFFAVTPCSNRGNFPAGVNVCAASCNWQSPRLTSSR